MAKKNAPNDETVAAPGTALAQDTDRFADPANLAALAANKDDKADGYRSIMEEQMRDANVGSFGDSPSK